MRAKAKKKAPRKARKPARITTVSVERVVSLGNYETVRMRAEAVVGDSSPRRTMERLALWLEERLVEERERIKGPPPPTHYNCKSAAWWNRAGR